MSHVSSATLTWFIILVEEVLEGDVAKWRKSSIAYNLIYFYQLKHLEAEVKLFHSRIIWGKDRKTSEYQELYSRQGENFFLIHLQEREKNKEKFLTPHGASLPARRRWGDSAFSISCNSPPMLGRVFSKCRTHLWPDGLVVSNYYVVVDPELCEVALH